MLSVDTTRPPVAAAAIEAGATIVNDVSGGLADPDMAAVVAADGRAVGAHALAGHSADMDAWRTYDDVVAEVRDELSARVDAALAAGVDAEAIVLDPGLGFAKTGRAQLGVAAANCDAAGRLGFPVLVGASRKRFLGQLLARPDGAPRAAGGREVATAAVSALAAAAGAWGVRVHDVGAIAGRGTGRREAWRSGGVRRG